MSTIREQVLANQDRVIRAVQVPEWDIVVRVRSLSSAEIEPLGEWLSGKKDGEKFQAELWARAAVLSVCDEFGTPEFIESDVPTLIGKRATAMQRIFSAFDDLNGFTLKQQREIEKNLPATGESNSGTDSPVT